MSGAARFLLALLGLPFLWALGATLLEGLATLSIEGQVFTVSRTAFLLGAGAMVALYAWKGQALMITYVFAHEMTHAVVGLCFLARVHRVSVRESGGFVELSKNNWVIALAPYCVPFYLLIALGICALTTWLFPDAVPFPCWAFLFGMLTLFHVLYTSSILFSVAQPDVREYGRLFSYWVILSANLFAGVLALSLTGLIPPTTQARTLLRRTTHAYTSLYRGVAHGAQFTYNVLASATNAPSSATRSKNP